MYFKPGIKESKKDFFDFKPELDALTRELRSMETRMVVIRGVRRTGKSSLLRIGLAESKLPHLLLDARTFGPFSPDQIYELMANSLSELIEKHRAIGEILRRVKGISIAGSRVDFVSRDRPVLVEVLEKLSEWGKSKGKPVVLALDEAQEFRLLPRFDSLLAHIYDYLMGIKLVLAGSEVGVLDEFLGRRKAKAPLFGRPYFEIRMERLPAERAEEFLTAGFEQLGKKVGAGEISGAVTLFDGIIRWLTSYGYYRSKTDHRKAAAKTIEEGTKLVKEELESFLAQRPQARARYISVLGMLASPMSWSEVKRGLSAKLGRTISDKQLSHYLTELVDYGFAVRSEGRYALADPLVKEAIRSVIVHPLKLG